MDFEHIKKCQIHEILAPSYFEPRPKRLARSFACNYDVALCLASAGGELHHVTVQLFRQSALVPATIYIDL
jgi:hypothetical protein